MSLAKLTTSALAIAAVSATAAAARDQVQVAGSSTVLPYASIVAEAFGAETDFPTPVVEERDRARALRRIYRRASIFLADQLVRIGERRAAKLTAILVTSSDNARLIIILPPRQRGLLSAKLFGAQQQVTDVSKIAPTGRRRPSAELRGRDPGNAPILIIGVAREQLVGVAPRGQPPLRVELAQRFPDKLAIWFARLLQT